MRKFLLTRETTKPVSEMTDEEVEREFELIVSGMEAGEAIAVREAVDGRTAGTAENMVKGERPIVAPHRFSATSVEGNKKPAA